MRKKDVVQEALSGGLFHVGGYACAAWCAYNKRFFTVCIGMMACFVVEVCI